MNIRTITIGVPLKENILELKTEIIDKIDPCLKDIETELDKEEINLRTKRINLSPLIITPNSNLEKTFGLIEEIQNIASIINIRWINLPFDIKKSQNKKDVINFAFDILKRKDQFFVNLIVAENNSICFESIKAASKLVKWTSELDKTGYNNFRLGLSCNPHPNCPFFPYTYSNQEVGISTGLELPEEFLKIIENSKNKNLEELREEILSNLSPKIEKIEKILKTSSKKYGLNYNGIDLSLAPFPNENNSVAKIMEKLGLEQFGCNGSLFLTSYLTDILKTLIQRTKIKAVGFNGVMFSLLEDPGLGQSNNSMIFSIDSLISYSAVCGCGLDMVPVPGNIFKEEIESIILDIAALSTKANKPLGIRILPIPGKVENEFTEFNMDFLINTRIKKIKNYNIKPNKINNLQINYKIKNEN